MEFQITNEISLFWENLVIPIVMGSSTIFFTLWIIGQYRREHLFGKFIKKNDLNKYVLVNGIYIPKRETKISLLKEQIKRKLGFSDTKPIFTVFIFILVMYGFHNIIIKVFQPNMVIYMPNGIFASGIDDKIIASLWTLIPEAKDLTQVYYFIQKNSENSTTSVFLLSIEAYLRLFIWITLITLVLSYRKNKRKVMGKESKKRVVLIIPVLYLLLAFTYFAQIQENNKIIKNECYEAYHKLENESSLSNKEVRDTNIYYEKIKDEKKLHKRDLYFDAYHIKIRGIEFFESLINEIIRYRS